MDPDTVGDIFPQDSDYDGAWKEALRLHLTDFLASFFPALPRRGCLRLSRMTNEKRGVERHPV